MSHAHPSTPRPTAPPDPRTAYWRSFEELRATPEFTEFLHREFPVAASEFPTGVSRRRWMQVMGASFALAGVAGCRWQAEELMPFAGDVPDYIPGVPQFFATSAELRGFSRGLLVTCSDGRPTKVEGNPEHPQSRGATDAFSQAMVLDLYDPDRAGGPRERADGETVERTWADAERTLRGLISEAGDGAGVRILAGASSSPSRDRLETALRQKLPAATWVEYEPLPTRAAEAGTAAAFGRRLRPLLRVENATVILCLDADILGSDPDSLNHIRGWAKWRTPEATGGEMNRLYVAESTYTSTGAAADHREPVASARIGTFLADLEAEIAGGGKPASESEFVRAVAADLVANRGRGLVVAGPRQSAAVQARVHRLNARLGNIGKTVSFAEATGPERPAAGEAITALTNEMQSGAVQSLIILRGNPAYDAPGDVDFAAALAKVPNAVHLGDTHNETSRLCRWFLPATHPFEQWGDGRSYDGTYTLQQPLIAPLHGGKSELELLAVLIADGPARGEAIVRETFTQSASGADWQKALHDGFVADTAFETVSASPAGGDAAAEPVASADGMELVFLEGETVYDGRFANNAWLQETPCFITKVTWDNCALLSPADANRLGVASQDVVRLTLDGKSVELPVYVLPGQATGSVAVAVGYGRTAAGLVGGWRAVGDETEAGEFAAPSVGTNVYPLTTAGSIGYRLGLTVEPTGKTHALATTQDHFAVDAIGLQEIAQRVPTLVREGTLAIYKSNPNFAEHAVHHPPLESLWQQPDYSVDHAWGMAIDLTKCVGCNACSVACQAENNVPVVGKEQVLKGREMHWLRLDRYFRGVPEGMQKEGERAGVVVTSQPVFCQHCEHAPCEQVCPVAATVHDHEGLNVMIYNRCVGTRYCSNNCPYKVRRFNFFNWEKQPVNVKYQGKSVQTVAALDGSDKYREANIALAGMVHNPEVTVRSRGVMEKCTYCTQRIQHHKITARNENRPIRDGEIKTACQQVCPADAIVFGDLLDPSARVTKLHYRKPKEGHAHPRAYAMLGELNVQPRTAYLARIRNPHPTLAEPYAVPASALKHHDGHDGEGHGDHGHGDEGEMHHDPGHHEITEEQHG